MGRARRIKTDRDGRLAPAKPARPPSPRPVIWSATLFNQTKLLRPLSTAERRVSVEIAGFNFNKLEMGLEGSVSLNKTTFTAKKKILIQQPRAVEESRSLPLSLIKIYTYA